MAHIITQACCSEASCLSVCPVNCIHPAPGDPDFGRTEMLYIDPVSCIDCGACVDVCPVDAISADFDITEESDPFVAINAAYYEGRELSREYASIEQPSTPEDLLSSLASEVSNPTNGATSNEVLRIAIVGAGPSGLYAAQAAVDTYGEAVEISIFEKLPTPFGLIRYGVAPDHQDTKLVADQFKKLTSMKNVRIYLNVEIGQHLSHEELLEHHHAVVYSVGTPQGQDLAIPGEDLEGSYTAAEFVAWYNGHPDYANREFDFSGERAVIFGNGNVALDAARILISDPEYLHRSDISENALAQLSNSNIREVVVIGRRGIAQSAYTHAELLGLRNLENSSVSIDAADFAVDRFEQDRVGSDLNPLEALKMKTASDIASQQPASESNVRLRYLLSPTAVLGDEKVEAVQLVRNTLQQGSDSSVRAIPTEEFETIDCSLVLRSVGFRSVEIAGTPVGSEKTLANSNGRVIEPDSGDHLTGVYVTGWLKRGSSGVIGSNRHCSAETVAMILEDFQQGILGRRHTQDEDFEALIEERQPEHHDFSGWRALDKHEKQLGRSSNRARVKILSTEAMLDVALSRVPAQAS